VVEKDFLYPGHTGPAADMIYPEDLSLNGAFFIKDAVNDVIEKVLESGGDVEFVENGVLADYGRVALIEYFSD